MKVRNVGAIAVVAVMGWATASWFFGLPPFQEKDAPVIAVAEQKEPKAFPKKPPFRFGSRAFVGICDEYSLDEESILLKQLFVFGLR